MKKKIPSKTRKTRGGPTAADVMTAKVATVSTDTTVAQLIERLRETKFSGFPVVDAGGRAVGLISQNDVLRALALLISGDGVSSGFQASKRKASVRLLSAAADRTPAVAALLARPVKDLMTPKVLGCAASDPLATVCRKMASARVHRVVVLERGKVQGLISATDVVRWVSRPSR